MKKEALLLLMLLTLFAAQAISQVPSQKKLRVKKGLLVILRDTTYVTKRDTILMLTEEELRTVRFRKNPYVKSSKFYDSLSKRAARNELTKDILDLIVKKKKRKEKLVSAIVESEAVFKPYEGYAIGSIVFKHVDLIEGSVIDTLQKSSTRFGKFVNKIHFDTRASIIEQNLLFEVGDLVDPYTLADNERILRQLKTLRDVRIYVRKNKQRPKVVDVIIVTQDVGSVGVSGSYGSLQNYQLDVYDVNILGYAKQLQVSYFRKAAEIPKNGYELTFREPNLLGTFIQGELQYTNNYTRQRTRLTLDRDFFTPEIKYAGGLDLYRTSENYRFEAYDTLEMPYRESSIDLWAGRSFEFRKRVNLIFSARANMREFTSSHFISSDSNSFFYDRTLLLGSVAIIKRNFLKSLRIRGFGKTEDIPVGGSLSAVFGSEINEFVDRTYVELDGRFGRYFPRLGYINISLAIGSFYKQGVAEDGLLAITSTYFSDLVEVRKMQLRQFIFFSYTKGFNRVLDQTISIAGKWEDNLARLPLGNKRITLGFETVYFMPWYTYGFQFALFHRFDLNLLSGDSRLVTNRSLFPSIRAGARMLNENLVFPGFAAEVGYFGKNGIYAPAWEVKFSLTIPDLFGTSQVFKPQVSLFD